MPFPSTKEERLNRIFFPHVIQKRHEVSTQKLRFAYYTTAETATSILRNREIWMRNTAVMNDYSEVEHGLECFKAAYESAPAHNFKKLLDNWFPDLADKVKCDLDEWEQGIRQDSYLTCLSEHLDKENHHGRLSMWRAYGGETGVALILNNRAMLSASHALNVYSSPVAYLSVDEFQVKFAEILRNVEEESAFIKALGWEKVKATILKMFIFTVLCTKHPGFLEEREWRVIATELSPPTSNVTRAVEVVRGIPQMVRKFSLQRYPDHALDLAIPELLDRIIIGPCAFPQIVRGAFLKLLQDAGVSQPEKMVIVSGIPLRHP